MLSSGFLASLSSLRRLSIIVSLSMDSDGKVAKKIMDSVKYNSNRIRIMPESKRQEVLQEFIREYSKNPGIDMYDQVRRYSSMSLGVSAA